MKKTANILAITDGRVLLTRSRGKTNWTLPGGKHKKGEHNMTCIRRECKEELPNANIVFILRFGVFRGISPHSHTPVTSIVFCAIVTGDITPGAEIEESRWFSKNELEEIIVSDLTRQILEAANF